MNNSVNFKKSQKPVQKLIGKALVFLVLFGALVNASSAKAADVDYSDIVLKMLSGASDQKCKIDVNADIGAYLSNVAFIWIGTPLAIAEALGAIPFPKTVTLYVNGTQANEFDLNEETGTTVYFPDVNSSFMAMAKDGLFNNEQQDNSLDSSTAAMLRTAEQLGCFQSVN